LSESKKPKKIVVALDGSIAAQNAAEIAIQIAKAESYLVEAYYIVDEPLILDPYADHAKELGTELGVASRAQQIEWFEKRGFSILDQFQEKCSMQGIPVVTKVLLGGVPDLALDKAKEIYFLALGRRGNSHASETDHLGENFRQIAHYANVPLIIGGDIITPIKRLFLVYDGSHNADLALKLSLQFERSFSAKVTIGLTGHMYLEDDPDALLFRLSEGGIEKSNIVDLRSKPVSKVVKMIAQKQSDLIIMGGYHHPEIMEWLAGSPNDQILKKSQIPAVIA
jgi:nucleotide-binding universal stress UspA family protein